MNSTANYNLKPLFFNNFCGALNETFKKDQLSLLLFFIILITCLFDIVKKNSILVTWSTYRVEEDNLKI